MAEAVAVARTGAPSREGGDVGILRDRYTVFPSRPLAHLDLPSAKAFVAEDRREIIARESFGARVPGGAMKRNGPAEQGHGAPELIGAMRGTYDSRR